MATSTEARQFSNVAARLDVAECDLAELEKRRGRATADPALNARINAARNDRHKLRQDLPAGVGS